MADCAGTRLQAREKERFRAAVMAWRNGGDTAATGEAETAPVPANEGGGKLLEGEYNEVHFVLVDQPFLAVTRMQISICGPFTFQERERKRFQDAVMEWRNGGKGEFLRCRHPVNRLLEQCKFLVYLSHCPR